MLLVTEQTFLSDYKPPKFWRISPTGATFPTYSSVCNLKRVLCYLFLLERTSVTATSPTSEPSIPPLKKRDREPQWRDNLL